MLKGYCLVWLLLLLLGIYTSGTLEIVTQCSKDDMFIAVLFIVLRGPSLGDELGDNPELFAMCLF